MFRTVLFFFVVLTALFVGCSSHSKTNEGLRYFNQSRYDQAILAFQAALQADPNNPDAYYNMAATYHQSAKVTAQSGNPAVAQQQYDEAEKNYRLCLSKDSNHTAAYRGLAVLFMERMNPEAAFQLLIGWSNAYPASLEPKIELARLYQEFAQISQAQGRTDVARECLEITVKKLQEVLATDPTNFRALRALGYLRELGGDLNNALSDYRLSLQSNPTQKDLATHIAQLEQRLGGVPGTTIPATSLPGGGWGSLFQGSGTGATVYNPSSSPASYSASNGASLF